MDSSIWCTIRLQSNKGLKFHCYNGVVERYDTAWISHLCASAIVSKLQWYCSNIWVLPRWWIYLWALTCCLLYNRTLVLSKNNVRAWRDGMVVRSGFNLFLAYLTPIAIDHKCCSAICCPFFLLSESKWLITRHNLILSTRLLNVE